MSWNHASGALLVALFAVAVVRWRKVPVSVVPALLLAGILLAAGAFTPWIWAASRLRATTGLPGDLALGAEAGQAVGFMLLVAALGALAGCLVYHRGRLTGAENQGWGSVLRGLHGVMTTQRLFRLSVIASAVILVAWLVGQGPSAWYRDAYLDASGSVTVARLANPLVPLALLGPVLTSRWTKSERAVVGVNLIVWWLCLASKGTRLAVLAPLIALGLILARRFGRSVLLRLAGAAGAVWLLLVTYQLIPIVRTGASGLSQLSTILTDARQVWPLGDGSWSTPVWFMAKNAAGVAPAIGFGVHMSPPSEVLWWNMNPLPAFLLNTPDTYDAERLWPFRWVPLPFISEVYGTWGAPVLFALMALVGFLVSVAASGPLRTTLSQLVAIATLSLMPLLAIMSMQYSSRNAFRAMSLVVILAAVQLACRAHERDATAVDGESSLHDAAPSNGPPGVDTTRRSAVPVTRRR